MALDVRAVDYDDLSVDGTFFQRYYHMIRLGHLEHRVP